MKRTTKKERAANARTFYNSFMNGYFKKAAFVVMRKESQNPNINRCQFWATPSQIRSKPVVIAESVDGITGCFIEFFEAIKPSCDQVLYDAQCFEVWVDETFGFRIRYDDGFVFMLER